jgi:hypothetical protein
MKTITKQIEAYTFGELSNTAKHNVIQWINDGLYFNVNDYDKCLIDKQSLHIKEYTIGSWDTNPIECNFNHVEFNFDSLIPELSDSIRDQRNLQRYARAFSYYSDIGAIFRTVKNYNYRHSQIDIDADAASCAGRTRRIDALIEKYREKLENHLRHCEYLAAKAISAEIDYRYSEEYAKDTCEANEYLFDNKGHVL